MMRPSNRPEKIDLAEGAALSRRAWLACASALALALPAGLLASPRAWLPAAQDAPPAPFSPQQHAFLEEMQRAAFLFFWEQADPTTGMIKDRALAAGNDTRSVSSIAATGFGLTALCLADRRGWEDPGKIRERVRNTLRFAATRLPHEHGFFYHFLHMRTGERALRSEVSSIDSAIFLCGALTCRAWFDDAEIRALSTQLYERVDWPWMLHGGKTLCMGWKPEGGFLKSRWDSYCELMMMYLLGLGSPTHPLSADTWDAWKRPVREYRGIRYIWSKAPLFVHLFSHAWLDFRGKRDRYADYFQNSVLATQAHKAWCLDLAKQFPHFSEDLWGITSSDSVGGYVAWGGPPRMGPVDGSVVPCAAGGSLPFLPQEALRVLRTIREKYGKSAWKRYGFVDAFNPRTNWYGPDIVGIDAGISLLMAENVRTGLVWETFMKNADVRRGMDRAGFHS